MGTSYKLGVNVENVILTAAGDFIVYGNALANEITGNDGKNILYSDVSAATVDKIGGDKLAGGKGDDTYYVNNATDTVTEVDGPGGGIDTVVSSVDFTLGAFVEHLELTGAVALKATGNNLDNSIKGNAKSNVLEGGEGADTLDGGAGADTASYINSDAPVTVTLMGQTLQGAGAGGHAGGDVLWRIENITGSKYADTLTGDAGANILDGGAGIDKMTGGAGNDTYYVDTISDEIVELANGGTDTVFATSNYALSAEIENATLLGNGYHYLVGNSKANKLTGNSTHNYLNGGLGADALDGGDGKDFASYSGSATAVKVSLASPSSNVGDEAKGDTYKSIEGLRGSIFADVLTGDAGHNYLDGNKGADTLNGGDGVDTADYYLASSGVTASLQDQSINTEDAQGDVYSSIERLRGSSHDDVLYGTTSLSINQLWGGGGADELHGTTSSFDYASYSWSLVGLTASLRAPGANTNEAAGDSYFSIEGLDGTYYDDQLYGNDDNNWLVGNLGADLLDGGLGYDTASYHNSTIGLTIDMTDASKGTGEANGDTFVSIERIYGSGFDDRIVGNGEANTIYGNGGNNTIDAGGGNDYVEGGNGNDRLEGGEGIDMVLYSAAGAGVTVDLGKTTAQSTGGGGVDTLTGFEQLQGSSFVDRLSGSGAGELFYGAGGNDTIDGKGGNDDLNGDAGNDTLIGGLGEDRFHFDKAHGAGFGNDTINDFVVGVDTIFFYQGIFSGFNAMTAATVDLGTSLKITSSFGSLTLRNIADKSQLSAVDFLFY